MSEDKTGGPAFPTIVDDRAISNDLKFVTIQGMTLHDWFAGMALQGYIAAKVPSDATYRDLAKRVYLAVDAMIEERKR
jgi:hypothetical protein